MFERPRWPYEALLPVAAGLIWLWCAASFGLVGFLFSVLPGCLLLGSGVSLLLWPGDDRITQFAALGGLLGVPFAVPVFWVTGPGLALLLIGLSAASFVAAGREAVRQEPIYQEVPRPELSLSASAQVAADEALLSTLKLTHHLPRHGDRERAVRELSEAHEQFSARGWLEKPAEYHELPPPLESAHFTNRRVAGMDFEHMSFESGYEPRPGEPGRERWLGYESNRTGHAWIVRNGDDQAPWLVGIHGYQMGWPIIDLIAFRSRPGKPLPVNLVIPTLPLHGKRKVGKRSGDGFLAGDFMDTIHAEAQAMWDMRRILSWVRGQGAERVGVFGLSLGGYNAALLASLDPDLACAITGIPVADIARITWRHGAPLDLVFAEWSGLSRDVADEALRVVSPLALEPRVPKERRYMFAAIGDRLVHPDQPRDLWLHWDKPRMVWYQGGHMTFRLDRGVRELIRDALQESGLTSEPIPTSLL